MFRVGQVVNTSYGQGVVVCLGTLKPHIYVRVESSSAIYILNESDVRMIESKINTAERTIPGKAESRNAAANHKEEFRGDDMKEKRVVEQTPLSIFVKDRLAELGMKQSEFCRLNGFDQGLLSRIQSSMITNLSLESTLRLAIGLSVSPRQILGLIGRTDLHFLVMRAYTDDGSAISRHSTNEVPPEVAEINQLAMRVHHLGYNLAPALNTLSSMATRRQEHIASEQETDRRRA